MTMGAGWRRSSRSFSNGNCVEIMFDPYDGFCMVRDSKDPGGPVLAFPPAVWRRWAMGIKAAWGTKPPQRLPGGMWDS